MRNREDTAATKLKRTICLLLLLFLALSASACFWFQSADLPEEGVWYCEELNLTISREEGVPSLCIYDGKQTEIELLIEHDDSTFFLRTVSSPYKTVFSGTCKRVENDKMTVADNGNVYEFVRSTSDAHRVYIKWSNSWFNDFAVEGDQVTLYCRLDVVNASDHPCEISLYGDFADDVAGGLLKESRLPAHDVEDTTMTSFRLEPGENKFQVVFLGDFAGTAEKRDRLLPAIEIVLAE